jgi:alkanesulfonate monooxygenase
MPAEIIGLVSTQNGSETLGYGLQPVVDPEWTATIARAHEEAGFDRVLIGYSASSPDGFTVASYVLTHTERLKVLIAHRPGFISPTLEARKLATLDQLTGGGRVAIHLISGGSDADQARDGDYLNKTERYERTGEFAEVLKRTLTATEPFDFAGSYYTVDGAFSAVKPARESGIPVFFGGQSEIAVSIGGQHAETFALFGEPLAQTAERIALINAEAARHGRGVDYSLSTRPVVAATEEEAWAKADEILQAIERNRDGAAAPISRHSKAVGEADAVSSARLQEAAASGDVHDERLWFGATRLAGPGGNSSGHVGTAEQVAEALIAYWDLGVRKFLIRGFDPLVDVRLWGDGLVPALRRRIAEREAAEAEALDGAENAPAGQAGETTRIVAVSVPA